MVLRKLVLATPIVFALHVAEEAPGFVTWFNSLVTPGISQQLFLMVNAVAFAITVLLTLIVFSAPSKASGLFLAAWIGFLMLANAVLHIVGTFVHMRYCPGVITATLLYLPFGVLTLRSINRELRLGGIVVAAIATLGALPMLVHGYLIVFRGSRLF